MEFWATNRCLPSTHARSLLELGVAINVRCCICKPSCFFLANLAYILTSPYFQDDYLEQRPQNAATARPVSLPPPLRQTLTAEIQAQTTDSAEHRLTTAIQVHTAAVKEQSRLLEKSLAVQTGVLKESLAVQNRVLENALGSVQQMALQTQVLEKVLGSLQQMDDLMVRSLLHKKQTELLNITQLTIDR